MATQIVPFIVTAGYFTLVIAAIAVEIRAHLAPTRIAPLGDMLTHYSHSRISRVGLTAAWWWFGWHFLFAPTVQLEL